MTQEEQQPPSKRHRANAARTPISTFVSVPRHPLGLKPSGNNLLSSSSASSSATFTSSLEQNLGKLHKFDDELLLKVISYVSDDPKDLLSLSHTSRVFYCYCYHEELWKDLYLKKAESAESAITIDRWYGSWRKSILKLETEALIQVNGLVCSDLLYRPYQCSLVDYKQIFKKLISSEEEIALIGRTPQNDAMGHIQRIPESEMTMENFTQNWNDTPFILTNVNKPSRWPLETCTIDYLLQNYANETMRQEAVKWSIELYLQYFKSNKDENPLYLFDPANKIIQDLRYTVPGIFQQDLFNLFQTSRPDHRWIIIGPARSGSTFHKDPNTTSAWNVTLQGRKLWVMTPPHVTPPGVSTDETEEEVTSPIGIAEWVLSGFYNDSLKMSQQSAGDCLIGMTFPGECMYVPSGWWHTVINIDDNIAITANFMPQMKLAKALRFFKAKNEQISGFHPNEVYEELEKLLPTLPQSASKELLTEKLEELKQFKNESEDIGELADVKLPIYEIFTSLLKLNGFEEELKVAESQLNDSENLRNKKEPVWDKITVEKSSFSFNFDEDED